MPTAAKTSDRLELRARAEPGAIPEIRHAVRDFAATHLVQDTDGVALAVTEAVTNAVLHAYREAETGDVRVVCCAEPTRLVVVVRDYGCGMSPRTDSPGLGIGLPTIAHLAGAFNIEAPEGQGTRLRMHFPRT
jgi:anti-sigma regulatory factor (Ser/Thr protein kinase)